jgi:fatty-acyl-CoA synthase
VAETDWYSIVYTSGTTGRPKGVIHRHREIIDHSMCMIESQRLRFLDRGLSVAPLYHVAELHCFFLPRVHVGAANILQHHLDEMKVWDYLAAEKITVMFGDPVTLERIYKNHPGVNLPDLRLIPYGASPATMPMIKKMEKATGAELLQLYGMAEMGPVVTVLYPEEHHLKAGSAGKALLNHQIRIVRPGGEVPANPEDLAATGETGEILIRGSGMMQGYYRHPEKTARAFYGGWYHSGDLGRLDEDGYLWITGRVDDAIITATDNIYPQEIEEVIREHPLVAEVAVAGLPGQGSEKTITAFVVPGDSGLTPEMLDSFVRESDLLAAFKMPARYIFVGQLPRTTTGKLIRHLLK